MAKIIRPMDTGDPTRYMRLLFLRTEKKIIAEITRKRSAGYADYAEVAALERVQRILQEMTDESWEYVPKMIEKIFYRSEKDASGYKNARVLTAPQTAVVNQLANNLLGEIVEASETAYKTVQQFYAIARLEDDPFRRSALSQAARQEAAGTGWMQTSASMAQDLKNRGITAFVDKAGRKWTLYDYCNMATRTTVRQAQVAAVLTEDDWDLWQIVKIGSTCPVCAPLEGRIYSKSGTNPDYPPLSLAFGKIDPEGPDDLSNTYLNIHPNCLHSLVRYTTIGKTEKQIQKDKDFSDPKKNPLTRDPRTKMQIAAYRNKERNRRKLLADIRQHKKYRAVLEKDVPENFDKFREMKYNNPERWKELQDAYKDVNWQRKALENHLSGNEHVAPYNSQPNSVFDNYRDGKIVQRRYYGRTGKPRLDIDMTDHGNSKEHPIVPHYHNWNESADGKLKRDAAHDNELKLGHRIANKDIL